MTPDNLRLCLNLSAIAGIVAVLWFLGVMLCREWVKNDLRQKVFEPLSVRWRPFASSRVFCAFNVVYADFGGFIHRARCWTYWHRREVCWEDDEVLAHDAKRAA